MTADKPSHLVPKLRFPEFRDAPDWEETTIGNMGEVITGSTPSTSRRDFYGGDFMFVSPADISDLRFVEETKKTLTEAGFAECRPIKKNSVLFVCIGSIGKVAQCSRPCATNQQINSLVVSPAFVAAFAYYLLGRESARITRLAGRQVVPIINKSLFATIKVPTPALAEQQKIADCLGSLDDLSASVDRKLEALRQHRQGLMQQLFPQSGETQPLLRFTEFRDAPDWEQAALDTFLDRPPDYGANAAAVPFSEDLPAYIRITDIDDDGRLVPAPRVSVDIEPSDDQFLQPGDMVLARTGASVGKSYRYRVEDGRLVFAGFLIRVRPNPDRLVPEFLSAYFSTRSYWDWVRLTSVRSGQPGINGGEYASMPLAIPTGAASLLEQHKIADCFTALDEGIAAQRQRLRALRCHKSGLLQQLFPIPKTT